MGRIQGQPRSSFSIQEGGTLMLGAFIIGYLIVSLLTTFVVYCACVMSARSEQRQEEPSFDQSDLDYRFNHLEWVEKANRQSPAA